MLCALQETIPMAAGSLKLGYRGVDKDKPEIEITHRGKDKRLTYEEHRLPKPRQGIEPNISYLKADHRMNRSHSQGLSGRCAARAAVRGGLQHPLALLRMLVKKGLGVCCACCRQWD